MCNIYSETTALLWYFWAIYSSYIYVWIYIYIYFFLYSYIYIFTSHQPTSSLSATSNCQQVWHSATVVITSKKKQQQNELWCRDSEKKGKEQGRDEIKQVRIYDYVGIMIRYIPVLSLIYPLSHPYLVPCLFSPSLHYSSFCKMFLLLVLLCTCVTSESTNV